MRALWLTIRNRIDNIFYRWDLRTEFTGDRTVETLRFIWAVTSALIHISATVLGYGILVVKLVSLFI